MEYSKNACIFLLITTFYALVEKKYSAQYTRISHWLFSPVPSPIFIDVFVKKPSVEKSESRYKIRIMFESFNPFIRIPILFQADAKVIYPKYSKHWTYTVAHN